MIFATIDYFNFVNRSGRYTRSDERLVLSYVSWSRHLPEGVWSCLPPGTAIGTANYGSVASWAIMYVTSGFLSHIATYAGNGFIIHAMPKTGVSVEPIDVLFGEKMRLYPVMCLDWFDYYDQNTGEILGDPRNFIGNKIVAHMARSIGQPYGYRMVILKALRIVFARDWELFRFKFLADFILIWGLADVALYSLTGVVAFSCLSLLHATIVAVNRLRWAFSKPDVNAGGYETPTTVLMGLFRSGWRPMPGGEGQNPSEQV